MEHNKLIKLKAAALEEIRHNGFCGKYSLYNFLLDIENGAIPLSPFVKSVVELYGDDNEEPAFKFRDFVKGFFGEKSLEERFVEMALDSLKSQKLVEYDHGFAEITSDGEKYLFSLERELRFHKLELYSSRLEKCATADRKPYICISFSYEDTEAAVEIAEMIYSYGYNVRLDSKIDEFYERTISRCELFVAVVSRSYIESMIFKAERECCFHERTAGFLPIYVEEVNNAPGRIASERGAFYKYASDSPETDLMLALRNKMAEKCNGFAKVYLGEYESEIYEHPTECRNDDTNSPYVYLSYAADYEEEAIQTESFLREKGYRVWRDLERSVSVEWYEETLDRIRGCEIVVAIASDGYRKSRYCQDEWHFANLYNKKILRLCSSGGFSLDRVAEGESVYDHDQLLSVMEYRGVRKPGVSAKPEPKEVKPKEVQPKTEESLPERQRQITPYEGDKPYIFVSYSHQNSDGVFEIIETLQQNGYHVWYDEGIHPATDWSEYLAEKINNCGYFIAFMSQEYLDSRYCLNELSYAFRKEKSLLLVYLSDVELTGGMAMNYDIYQAIYKYKHSDYEKFGEKLMSAEGLNICKD